MQLVFSTLSQVVLAIALPYILLYVVLGVRVARREGGALGAQEGAAESRGYGTYELPYHLYFLVPCLNEEAVIGATVARLLTDTPATVIVVDDDSEDATASEARRAAGAVNQRTISTTGACASGRLLVVDRRLPHARMGKGPALNAGYRALLDDVARRGLDPAEVVVGVMDADGRLSSGAAAVVLRRFDDSRIGGVQLIVRIRNRGKLITRIQDIEFWMISAISQFARTLSGTVSLGGNGQFVRLTALQALGSRPWSSSLTEDLDLALQLVAAGWRLTTVSNAHVDQQGVATLRRLLRQRTRWYQGTMSALGRLPELWNSRHVSQVALVEVLAYLLVPWLVVLPWSVIQQWVLFQLLFGSGHGIIAAGLGPLPWRVGYGALWYAISFLPNLLIGVCYARRTRTVSFWQALVLGHLMLAWNYVGYVSAWRALGRMVVGRRGWSKTARYASSTDDVPTEASLPAVAIDR